MGDVTTWAPTAAGNNLNPPGPPDYPSENQSRSSLNNCIRENMSAVRRLADDGGWFDHGHTYAYVSATVFQAQNADYTAIYLAGRPVRAVGTTTGTIYGVILSSTFSSPHTVVTCSWASGQLENEALTISVGLDPRAVPTAWRVGDVKEQSHSSIEAGWLEASGQAVLKTDYPALDALYAADSYPFGSDATTFNLPPRNGRAGIGRGQGNTAEGGGLGTTYALGDTAGAETHTLTASEIPAHAHTGGVEGSQRQDNEDTGGQKVYDANTAFRNTGSVGGDQPHNNQSPVLGMVYVVKVL